MVLDSVTVGAFTLHKAYPVVGLSCIHVVREACALRLFSFASESLRRFKSVKLFNWFENTMEDVDRKRQLLAITAKLLDTKSHWLALTAQLLETDTTLKSVEAELKALQDQQLERIKATTFHAFRDLPPELRHTIWNLACFPRLVPFVEDIHEPGFHTRIPCPPILAVCKEAREVALRMYQKVHYGDYFSYERDTLVVCETWRDREYEVNEDFDPMMDMNSDNDEYITQNAAEPSILHNLRRICSPSLQMFEREETVWIRDVSDHEQYITDKCRLDFIGNLQSIAIPFIAWQGLSSFESKEHLEASAEIMDELLLLPKLKEIVLLVHNQPHWQSHTAYEAIRPRETPRTAIGSSAIFRLKTDDWQTMDDYALIGFEQSKVKITHMCGARLYERHCGTAVYLGT